MKNKLKLLLGIILSIVLAASVLIACNQPNPDPGDEFVIHTVTIAVQDDYSERKIVDMQRLPRPADPKIEGLYFEGWSVGDEPYDFSKKVLEDFTLEARFTPEASTYLVSGFVRDELGNAMEDVTVTFGTRSVTSRKDGSFGFDTALTSFTLEKEGFYPVVVVRAEATARQSFDVVLVEEGQTEVLSKNTDKNALSFDLNDSVRVKLFRMTTQVDTGTSSSSYLKVRFEVKDNNLTNVAVQNNTDQVCQSDSVEFYLDTLCDGGLFPQTDDYQIDVSVSGFYRCVKGTGNSWVTAENVSSYVITQDGTVNDTSDVDYGYTLELHIPFGQVGITDQSDIAFSVGQSGYGTTNPVSTWNGWTYKGTMVDPQAPAKYRIWGKNGIQEILTHEIEIAQSYVDGLAQIMAPKLLKVSYGERVYLDNERDLIWHNLPENMMGTTMSYGPSTGTRVTVEIK